MVCDASVQGATVAAALVGLMILPVAARGGGGGTAVLHGNTAKALIASSTKLGPTSAAAEVQLQIGLAYQPDVAPFISATVTPGSDLYRQFLSPGTFARRFDQPAAAVEALTAYLQEFGIEASQPFGNLLDARGTVGEVERAFSVSINNYQQTGHSYFANQQDPSLPADFQYQGASYDLAAMVSGLAGMTTYNGIRVLTSRAPQTSVQPAQACQNFCGAPAGYSPEQIASYYDATKAATGATGQGMTIAVATLAPLKNSDARAFWDYYKIDRTGRLSQVSVDGAPTHEAIPGSGGSESSLDVERSGAMAPGANVIAYIAPNTNNGFIDLFETVVSQDRANVMTTSWGLPEQDETQGYATLLNQAFEQGAAEGISMFAASGDSGAYDAYPQYKTPSVDSPASSPYITAAGGTTLPSCVAEATRCPGSGGVSIGPSVDVGPTTEAAWGWSYLAAAYADFGLKNPEQGERTFYPIGSGGGYSLYFAEPKWQGSFQSTGQRGVPDVALNSDPFTGYAIYDSGSTYSNAADPWSNGWGGTSFAAPQWAGITALLGQATGGPMGFASGVFYSLPKASGGTVEGFTDVTTGNNWGFSAASGWDPATGLGVPNVAALAQAILDA